MKMMNFKAILDFFYMSEREAIITGFTHEGRVFGIPSWLVIQPGSVDAVTKMPVLQVICMLGDKAMNLCMLFVPYEVEVPMPITIGRKLHKGYIKCAGNCGRLVEVEEIGVDHLCDHPNTCPGQSHQPHHIRRVLK